MVEIDMDLLKRVAKKAGEQIVLRVYTDGSGNVMPVGKTGPITVSFCLGKPPNNAMKTYLAKSPTPIDDLETIYNDLDGCRKDADSAYDRLRNYLETT